MVKKSIIISGYCATGKSTFSQKISDEFKIPYFNKDFVKENMADGFGLNNQEVFNKGSIATFNLMLHILEQFLQVGKICILEANFKKYEIEDIQKLLTKYNSTCLTYLFRADFEIIFRRFKCRSYL